MADQVLTGSICTTLQGTPPMEYEYAARDLLSSEVPQDSTTRKTEHWSEENMMGVKRSRIFKASLLPLDCGTVNWYNASLNLDGKPSIICSLRTYPEPASILERACGLSSCRSDSSWTGTLGPPIAKSLRCTSATVD